MCASSSSRKKSHWARILASDLPKYSSTYEIVGIVRNAKYTDAAGHRDASPMFFVPLAQRVHYDDAMMQSIDDSTHFIEGAVLQLQGSMDGLEPQVRASAQRGRSQT